MNLKPTSTFVETPYLSFKASLTNSQLSGSYQELQSSQRTPRARKLMPDPDMKMRSGSN